MRSLACRRFGRILNEIADRAPTEREDAFLVRHRAACETCRCEERAASFSLDLLRNAALAPEVEDSFDRRVLRRARVQRVQEGFRYWSPAFVGGVVAAGLLLAAVQMLTKPIAPGATAPLEAGRGAGDSLALRTVPSFALSPEALSPRLRALVGAAAGAVLVLIAHPVTRPSLVAVFRPTPPDALARILRRPPLAKPTDAATGAAYLLEGARRRAEGPALAAAETRTMLAVAAEGEAIEPDNPFWPMAAFYFGRGEDRAAWRRASRCKRFFDHQRVDMIRDRDRIVARVGDAQGWVYAAIAPQRSPAMIEGIRNTALRTLQGIDSESAHLEFAYETIRNGALIRDGAERLALGQAGIDMIESATYPRRMVDPRKGSKILRLYIAKTTFTRQLRDRDRPTDARFCDRQFRTNDSWQAFRDVVNPDDRFNALAIGAVQADTLPGALLAASLAGGAIWLFGRRVARLAHLDHRFRGSGLTACSLGLLVAGILLGYTLVGLAAGACVLVSGLHPQRPKRFDGDSLGPLHVLVVGSLATALGIGIVLAVTARSLPGIMLGRLGGLGLLLGDSERWSAVAVVILGASALAPPAWAFVRRYPTPALAAHTYTMMGRSLALGGLALAVVSSPVALAVDRWLGTSLAEIALNEQNAYSPNTGGSP